MTDEHADPTEPTNHAQVTDPTRGPWTAIALDEAGYVLDADDMDDCVSIAVVRGTGMPTSRDGDVPQTPDTCERIDALYEIQDLDDEPKIVPIVWEQAQAVATALNAHAQAGAR